jgi:hypothetical protein
MPHLSVGEWQIVQAKAANVCQAGTFGCNLLPC